MFIRGLFYASTAGLYGYFYESEQLPNFLIESPLTNKIRIGSRDIIMGEPFVRKQLKIERDVAKRLTERQWQLIKLIKQAKEELTDIDYISVYFDDGKEENGAHGRVRAISSRHNNSALVHISNDRLLKEDELEGVVYHAIASIKNHNFAKYLTRCQNENPQHDKDDRFAAIKTSEINYSDRLDNLYNTVARKV